MKTLILDSTFRDSIVIDNNDLPHMIPCNNCRNRSNILHKSDLPLNNCNYVTHHTNSYNLDAYSFLDYL